MEILPNGPWRKCGECSQGNYSQKSLRDSKIPTEVVATWTTNGPSTKKYPRIKVQSPTAPHDSEIRATSVSDKAHYKRTKENNVYNIPEAMCRDNATHRVWRFISNAAFKVVRTSCADGEALHCDSWAPPYSCTVCAFISLRGLGAVCSQYVIFFTLSATVYLRKSSFPTNTLRASRTWGDFR